MQKTPGYIEYEDGTRVALDEDDSPEWTEEDFAKAKKFSDLPVELQEGLQSLKRGRPKAMAPKQLISFRLDAELVAHLKNEVDGYNRRVEALILDAWHKGQL